MFSSITEAWNHDPVKEMTKKINNKDEQVHTSENLSLSLTDESISLFSEQYKTPTVKQNYKLLSNDSDTPFSNSDCKSSIQHLKKCLSCNNKLNTLIDKKVQNRIDKIMLDEKIKLLDINKNTPKDNKSDMWKNPVLIVAVIVILILILFIIFRK